MVVVVMMAVAVVVVARGPGVRSRWAGSSGSGWRNWNRDKDWWGRRRRMMMMMMWMMMRMVMELLKRVGELGEMGVCSLRGLEELVEQLV